MNSHKSLIKSLARLWFEFRQHTHTRSNNCESRDSDKLVKNKFTFRFFIAWVAVKCVWLKKRRFYQKNSARQQNKLFWSIFRVLVTTKISNLSISHTKKTFCTSDLFVFRLICAINFRFFLVNPHLKLLQFIINVSTFWHNHNFCGIHWTENYLPLNLKHDNWPLKICWSTATNRRQ